jgi:hypothetical protein
MFKTKTERVLLLVVAFLGGCEASRVANVVVPTAHAAEPNQRFEYYCLDRKRGITDAANTFGREGWRLVAAAGAGWGTGLASDHRLVWCFEHPLEGASAPPPVSPAE